MHEEIIRDLLYQILGCGWRDIDFISSISYKTWTEINIDEIKSELGTINANTIIYWQLYKLVHLFIQKYQQKIEEILGINDIYWYMSEHDIFSIYVNYFDSSVSFENPDLQALFDNSEYWL